MGLAPEPVATAIVSLYDFQVPNLIQSFLDITDGQSAQGLKLPVLDNLPTKSLLTNGSSFHFPGLGLGSSFTSFGLLGGDVDLNLPLRVSRTFTDANELFQTKNISTDLRQFIEHFFDFANAEGSEEDISSPGVQETKLSIMVQQDQVELLNEIINLLKTPQGRREGFPLKQ